MCVFLAHKNREHHSHFGLVRSEVGAHEVSDSRICYTYEYLCVSIIFGACLSSSNQSERDATPKHLDEIVHIECAQISPCHDNRFRHNNVHISWVQDSTSMGTHFETAPVKMYAPGEHLLFVALVACMACRLGRQYCAAKLYVTSLRSSQSQSYN